MLKSFARKARERIRLEDGGYRRHYLRALAQRVEADDAEARIMEASELLRRTAPSLREGNRRRSEFCSEMARLTG